MVLKNSGIILVLAVLAMACSATNTPDIILDRNLTLRKANILGTYDDSIRSLNIPRVRQILYLVFTPIEVAINTALNLVCVSISPLVAIVNTFQNVFLSNLISLVDTFQILVILAPQYSVTLTVIKVILNLTNYTVGNLTSYINNYGCTATSGIQIAIDNVINSIIGLF